MSDDDKPFVCYERSCGMRFTNEDHLAVHMRKHDMSLALNLSTTPGGLSPLGLFTDQTPTPTKFLKNCEEMGLFQELSKNPFDDSFKKAMDEPADMSAVETTVELRAMDSGNLDTPQPPVPRIVLGDADLDTPQPPIPRIVLGDADLDTPQPPIPRIVVGDEEMLESEKHSEKAKDLTLSSIVPKKRKKYLSQSISLPTSTTSEDEEEPTIASSSTEETGLHSETIHPTHGEPVTHSETITDTEPVKLVAKKIEPVQSPPVVTFAAPVAMETPVTTATAMHTQPKPVPVASPGMVTVLLHIGGQNIPVQVPPSMLLQQGPVTPILQQTPVTPILQQPLTPQLVKTSSNQIQQMHMIPVQAGNGGHLVQPLPIPNMQTLVTPQGGSILIQTAPTPVAVKPTQQVVVTRSQQNVSGLPNVLTQSGSQSILKSMTMPGKQTIAITQNNISRNQPITGSSALREALTLPVSSSTNDASQSGSQSYTKQRLKAALQQQTTPTHQHRASQFFQVKQEPQLVQEIVSSSGSVTTNGDYSRQTSSTELPDDFLDSMDVDRRSKFLERNRAAAARCREKRKRWVSTLQQKSDDLSNVNNRLCSEIKKLRGDVAQLKTLLLAHKDCPVTAQQRSLGHLPAVLNCEDVPLDSVTMDLISSTDDNLSNQSAGEIVFPAARTGTQSGAEPMTSLPVVQPQNNQPLVTVSQPVAGAVTLPIGLVSSFVNVNQIPAGVKPMSVITGPNSLAMIPKLLNMENHVQIISSSKS